MKRRRRDLSTPRPAQGGESRSKAAPGLKRAVIVGERVFLRRPGARDREEYIALRQANRKFLRPWEPIMHKGKDEFGPVAFDSMLRVARSPRYCKLLVCLKDTGQLIGSVNLNCIAPQPFLSTTIGYWIGKAWTHNGLMTEAVNLIVKHAFTNLKLHRVEANIMPVNAVSLALIKGCGFRFEGLAKRYLQINGKWSDHERWAMTVEDWKSR